MEFFVNVSFGKIACKFLTQTFSMHAFIKVWFKQRVYTHIHVTKLLHCGAHSLSLPVIRIWQWSLNYYRLVLNNIHIFCWHSISLEIKCILGGSWLCCLLKPKSKYAFVSKSHGQFYVDSPHRSLCYPPNFPVLGSTISVCRLIPCECAVEIRPIRERRKHPRKG